MSPLSFPTSLQLPTSISVHENITQTGGPLDITFALTTGHQPVSVVSCCWILPQDQTVIIPLRSSSLRLFQVPTSHSHQCDERTHTGVISSSNPNDSRTALSRSQPAREPLGTALKNPIEYSTVANAPLDIWGLFILWGFY